MMAVTKESRKRRVFLDMVTVAEAQHRVEARLETLLALESQQTTENLPPERALNRVTAEPVFAVQCNPHYCACAMDGFAVNAADTEGATESSPKQLAVPSQAHPVNTGEPLPEGFDAVIMIEDVYQPDGETVEIMASAAPWQHVRLLGEDIVATELVATSGYRLGPVEISAMIASQIESVPVRRKPRVALLPTGTEVVRFVPGMALRPGQVIDYDTPLLSGLIAEWGGESVVLDPVPDDPEQIGAALIDAARRFDVVALIAGSSAGTADHVPNLIEQLGELLFHGVRLSPGKPAAAGVVEGTFVLGVPGYSVAAWTAFDLFAKPVISRLLGVRTPERPIVTATFRRKIPSRAGSYELLRVRLAPVAGRLVAVPLKRGAGAINSLTRADGLARIGELEEGVNPGEEVDVELLIPSSEVERTVMIVGSHDISLDLLAAELALPPDPMRLASAHVGSMGGLRALRMGEAHLAGIHLLEPADGTYNVSYIKRVLPDVPLRLINLVHREVGLMVPKGNPKAIKTIEDLVRSDVVMINRQRGAGTRVLLDHLLKQEGLESSEIAGYSREVTTHTMVAAAVSGAAADVGIGIRAAATALGLDFVPLTLERYDLAVPRESLEHAGVSRLLRIITADDGQGQRYRRAVEALGGYRFEESGKVLYEQ